MSEAVRRAIDDAALRARVFDAARWHDAVLEALLAIHHRVGEMVTLLEEQRER